MNITEIRNGLSEIAKKWDVPKLTPITTENTNNTEKSSIRITDSKDIAAQQSWQKEILLNGLDMLENKIQMANTGTILDKTENKPIESFTEALDVLKFVKTELFAQQAFNTQANISPSVVYELLTDI